MQQATNTTEQIESSRISYSLATLNDDDVADDPFVQAETWFAEALAQKEILEPNAMTVASVDALGRPSARIVLMRGFDSRGCVFFTNYDSRKGRELDGSHRAAALFYWDRLQRELRIEGPVDRISAEESDAYFSKRPRGHRIAAWASPQSAVIATRAILEAALAETEKRFPDDVPRPPFWGGYRITPDAFEFWQGRKDRVHDRQLFRASHGQWLRERLAP